MAEHSDIGDLVDEAVGESPDLEDKILEDGLARDYDAEVGGMTPIQEESYAQPVSRATMVCLRGPCVYHWALTARFHAPGKEMRLKRVRTCTMPTAEETNLGGQNVYHCTRWWPAWLDFVPEALRHAMKPALNKLYDKWLARQGYDLSWKFWPDWLFESDSKEFRSAQGIGAPRPDLRAILEQLRKAAPVTAEEDDDV